MPHHVVAQSRSLGAKEMIRRMDTRLRVLLTTLLAILALLLAALAGCGVSPSPIATAPVRSPTAIMPATTPTATTPSPVPTPIQPIPSFITLTIWGPEQFAPGGADAGRQVLQAQYQAFMSENADLGLEYVLKAAHGEGGLLHSLLSSSYAAPDTLPDVAIIDAFELGSLARAGIAQPLQELIAEELKGDLFPFAQEACTFDGELIALQFETDIEHLVYYTRTLEAPPIAWADLFTETVTYIFPAAGEGGLVNDAFLIQYMAQGGQLVDEAGRPNLEASSIQRVLRLYDEGTNYDIIPSRVLELSDLDECWAAYTEGNITVSHISSWRYLSISPLLQSTTFSSLPTETGTTATMSRGWAFVIITLDPRRQAAAARFTEWLVAPQNLAEWSLATNHLPTRPSALRLTVWPEDYTDFLATQLENAFFRPSTSEFDKIAQALQGAVEDVLTDQRTAREATSDVMESIQ
jgi:ABC-type glycerol-3-phosphate transport system substrate-binding protein